MSRVFPFRSTVSVMLRFALPSVATCTFCHVSVAYPIADLHARLLGGRVLRERGHYRGPLLVQRDLGALKQHERHDNDGQGKVHDWAHDEHLESLPLRLRQELVGRAGAGVLRRLARHLHVAAERHGADAVLGVAAAERDQLGTEAE
jgi:hypothetical protein